GLAHHVAAGDVSGAYRTDPRREYGCAYHLVQRHLSERAEEFLREFSRRAGALPRRLPRGRSAGGSESRVAEDAHRRDRGAATGRSFSLEDRGSNTADFSHLAAKGRPGMGVRDRRDL